MGDSNNTFPGKSSNQNNRNRSNGSVNGYYGGEVIPGQHQTESDGDEINLGKIFESLLRYKWAILVSTVLGVAAAWFYAQNVTPMYRSSGTLLIKEERGSYYAGSDLSSMLSRSYGIGLGSTIENEIQLIRSRRFAQRIADKIVDKQFMEDGNVFPVMTVEDYPDSLLTSGQVAGRFMNRMSAETMGRDVDVVNISFESPSRQEAYEVVNMVLDEYVAISREQSRASVRSALTFLGNELGQIGRNLEDSEVRFQNFMESEGVIKIDKQTEKLIDQVSVLESELETQRITLASLRQALENYEQELDEIRPGFSDQVEKAIAPRLDLLQQGLAELEVERMLILGKNPGLVGNEEAEGRLREINAEIRTYTSEIRQLSRDIMESGLYVGFLEDERGNVAGRVAELRRQMIDHSIRINQHEAQEAFIQNRLQEFNRQFDNIPAHMIQMARLQRDLQVNQELFVTLSQQQAELSLLEQTQMGSGRIFDYAFYPGSPFAPRVQIILLLGFMLGFGLSAGLVLLKSMLNKQIDSIDHLKEYDYPLLAVVPEMDSIIEDQFKGKTYYDADGRQVSTSLVSLFDPVSHVAESYRRLYNNIRFNNPDHDHNILVVTSASKGEGKTTCISNLAIAIAETGKNVLLMDCDYRRPRVHRIFGIEREPGSTNYLFDQQPVDKLIVPSVIPGVDLLPSGTEPTSPGLAINSAKMRDLVKDVSKKYDYVLIDTPPYGIITDAAPLMKMADGVIAITRFKKTSTPELDQLLENMNNIRVGITGLVLMDYDPEEASGYYAYNKMYSYSYSVYKSYHKEEAEDR